MSYAIVQGRELFQTRASRCRLLLALQPEKMPGLGFDDGDLCEPPVGVGEPLNRCSISIKKISYPLDCAAAAQNTATRDILDKTVALGTEISTIWYDGCGVIGWTCELTEKGAEVLRKTVGVLEIVPDIQGTRTGGKRRQRR